MAYIITEPCIDVKDGDCTLACPVDCIYEGGRMFDAIVWDQELTDKMRHFEKINRDFFETVTGWGTPGGWDAAHTTEDDHPLVAAHPKQETSNEFDPLARRDRGSPDPG